MQTNELTKKHKLIFLVLIALLMFKPAPGILFGSFSVKIIPIIILLISFVVLLIMTKDWFLKNPKNLYYLDKKPDYVTIFLSLGALSLIISTVYGIIALPKAGLGDFIELYRYAFYISFYLIAREVRVPSIKQLIFPIFLFILAIEIFGILQFFNIFNINNHIGLLYTQSESLYKMIDHQHRVTSTFQNPNMYGSFLIIVVALVLSYMTIYKTNPIIGYGFITLSLLSVFFTTSRTAVIITAGVIVYWLLLRLVLRKGTFIKSLSQGLIVLGIFAMLALVVIPKVPYLDYAADQIISGLSANAPSEGGEDSEGEDGDNANSEDDERLKRSVESVSSFKNRYYYWNLNLEKFKESPIIGSGPMKEGFVRFADNSYLYTLARYGILGLLVLAGLYLYIYARTFYSIVKGNKSKQFLGLAINLTIVGYAVMGMVAEVWYNLQSITILFIIIGLMFNKFISDEEESI
ncbi:O-antigen ligase family protein [Mesobacillus selenatarsenatis]|uniref:O-antigen ligase-related domain-containing protein n=1 Tax=Mesobacillus selenatarsenatis (strain DSM 18680 / JCM 14380 / FERM P-15431 / SF-1) TaxID=1321606 RepID=A0A0A8X1K9_MESS1|nr:O-antigen ligase family protein [Mesobacillus selenatarsenatis]GAM12021.1 hypothetical protein SAMD00020551_0140 [Mesobacillus selenatarsenatis SF-1]